MVVMILQKTPPRLRGELSRWLLEPAPGVFVGHVTAMVRDRLWEKCCKEKVEGGVLQVWSTNTEQRFQMRVCGSTRRRVIENEGLMLVLIPEGREEDEAQGMES